MVKIVEQDIFEAPIDILVHCCNCQNIMGTGIAAEIKSRFRQVYEADLATKKGDINKLGTYNVVSVEHPRIKYVVNLYAQFHYGHASRHVNYEAFYNGIETLRDSLINKGKNNLVVGFPWGICCKNAGGNWMIVSTMIEEVFRTSKLNVLICKND